MRHEKKIAFEPRLVSPGSCAPRMSNEHALAVPAALGQNLRCSSFLVFCAVEKQTGEASTSEAIAARVEAAVWQLIAREIPTANCAHSRE